MPLYINDLTDEERESVMAHAQDICICGGAGIPPWPWPCGGHLRQALDEFEANRLSCVECGEPVTIDGNGVSSHDDSELDLDHTAIPDELDGLKYGDAP